MARYGDLDSLALKWMLASPKQRECFRQIIDEHPASDVVPKSEWISVEERLPVKGQQCLICIERLRQQYPAVGKYECERKWLYTDVGGLMYTTGVTHWMPLPEPPRMHGGE